MNRLLPTFLNDYVSREHDKNVTAASSHTNFLFQTFPDKPAKAEPLTPMSVLARRQKNHDRCRWLVGH